MKLSGNRLLVLALILMLILALTGCGIGPSSPAISAIAAGAMHSLALKSDGTVWAWGDNGLGELGNGTTTASSTPVEITSLTGVTAIAAGYFYSLALKSDGTVWAWGYNVYGQLGNGTTADSSNPVQVSTSTGALTGVIAIAAGYRHSLALKSDGTVWAWGFNGFGQLGDGTTTASHNAVQASLLTGASACSVGFSHSLVLKSDETVWALGYNDCGQLGDGTTTQSDSPVQVLSASTGALTGVVAIKAGYDHNLALKSDGTVWAWGYNVSGQLGNGTRVDSNKAVVVCTSTGVLLGVSSIAAGEYHNLALKNGTVWAWGFNTDGELGNGTRTSSSNAVEVSSLTGVSAIAAGDFHSLALKSDGTVWAWGDNEYGQLGDGTTADSTTPVQVNGF